MTKSNEMFDYQVLISIENNEGTVWHVRAKDSKEAIKKALEELKQEFEGFEIKVKCTRRVKDE